MNTLRLPLLILLMVGTVWSCTDHRNSPAAPERLRLKTTDNSIPNAGVLAGYQGRTEYNYDQMGRLSSVLRPGVSRAAFTYDGQDRILKYDNKSETSAEVHRIVFGYSPDGSQTSVKSYQSSDTGLIIEESPFVNQSGGLSFGADGRVVGWSTGVASTFYSYKYEYTNDNVTFINATLSRTTAMFRLAYDDKPNPYYRLITPNYNTELANIDSDDMVRRSNRNNVAKFSDLERATGNVFRETFYEYEYNAQGLPTKARVKGQSGELVFTYESY